LELMPSLGRRSGGRKAPEREAKKNQSEKKKAQPFAPVRRTATPFRRRKKKKEKKEGVIGLQWGGKKGDVHIFKGKVRPHGSLPE